VQRGTSEPANVSATPGSAGFRPRSAVPPSGGTGQRRRAARRLRRVARKAWRSPGIQPLDPDHSFLQSPVVGWSLARCSAGQILRRAANKITSACRSDAKTRPARRRRQDLVGGRCGGTAAECGAGACWPGLRVGLSSGPSGPGTAGTRRQRPNNGDSRNARTYTQGGRVGEWTGRGSEWADQTQSSTRSVTSILECLQI